MFAARIIDDDLPVVGKVCEGGEHLCARDEDFTLALARTPTLTRTPALTRTRTSNGERPSRALTIEPLRAALGER